MCIPYDQDLPVRINNATLPSEALFISVLDDHALTTGYTDSIQGEGALHSYSTFPAVLTELSHRRLNNNPINIPNSHRPTIFTTAEGEDQIVIVTKGDLRLPSPSSPDPSPIVYK